ncbi:pachytene checkpoint protein 2 [Vespula squamosa]|uniref:Pachytene checkpoint protein 2 n=1 Tax=Vespula squamosa TaxID=30214 RepID=A0ABD1ZYD6_VESSQ
MDATDILHVEILQKSESALSEEEIRAMVHNKIIELEEVSLDVELPNILFTHAKDHIESVLCACNHEKTRMKIAGVNLQYHIYRMTETESAMSMIENGNEELPAANQWLLPSKEFHYLWENMYYDSDIKQNLLNFVETAVIFSDNKINPNIISWNKVVLLHGPPGSGKTSLCKALAQKIAIRFVHRFTFVHLIEINSHSLFSKWFSESGKLVMKLFEELKTLHNDSNRLVCILIDEVESLAHVRKSCVNGTEPTDSIRVVNALLTQLDQMKHYPNVLILTTSNMTEAIDLAFVDRADIKQYIGHPTEDSIYKIYSACIKELMRTGLIEQEQLFNLAYLKTHGYEETYETKRCLMLLEISKQSFGLSGRTLKKIPFLAKALFIHSKKSTLAQFLRAMHYAIEKQKDDVLEQ